MSTNLIEPATAPKRRTVKKASTAKKTTRARKTDATAARSKTKKRHAPAEIAVAAEGSSVSPPVQNQTVGPKYFLGREGVAFGPYTEFQLRESLRLEIFERDDLALAEDGTEWSELSRLFPIEKSVAKQAVGMMTALPQKAELAEPPQEVKLSLPNFATTKARPAMRRSAAPLSEHHLREHALSFADTPSDSLASKFTDRRFALAAIPAAAVVLCLVLLAAFVRQHEPVAKISARPTVNTAVSATVNQPKAPERIETAKLAANASGIPR